MILPPLPRQDPATPWPTKDWPTAPLPFHADRAALDRLLADAFDGRSDQLGETHALVIIHAGRLVLERYAPGFGPDSTFPSWSKAKSITQALAGILVGDGKIDIHAPAAAPEWDEPGDPRSMINIDQLLRMSSGLKFVEDYVPGHTSDVIDMLFGSGKADVAHYAASQPLIHPPGAHWSYASGATNIVARALASALGTPGAAAFEAFMVERLFGPLGMTSPRPKFDSAGTFIGSSYCYATAQDFARFGLLYLRNGVWEDGRLLPEGWVDYARTPTPQPPDTEELGYGAHWWLGITGEGSFSANGYEGQYTVCVPDLDLVIVRHGKTPLDQSRNPQRWIAKIADCFRL